MGDNKNDHNGLSNGTDLGPASKTHAAVTATSEKSAANGSAASPSEPNLETQSDTRSSQDALEKKANGEEKSSESESSSEKSKHPDVTSPQLKSQVNSPSKAETIQKELGAAISELSLIKEQLGESRPSTPLQPQQQKLHLQQQHSASPGLPAELGEHINNSEQDLKKQVADLRALLETTKSKYETKLKETEKSRDDYQAQYQVLREKVGLIRTQLGDKLKRDAQEVAQQREEIKKLENEKKGLNDSIETLKRELITSTRESDSLSKDLSKIRRDFQSAIESWESEEDKLVREVRGLKDKLSTTESLTQNLASSIQDEKAIRANYSTKIQELEEQVASQTNYAERYRSERDSLQAKLKKMEADFSDYRTIKTSKIDGLETEILDLKEKNVELTTQRDNAEEKIKELSSSVENVIKLQQQIKEKNLIIGKLRHEAVTLNEHLTKALRVIKENSQGETVDRQLVTNMLLSFVTLPRADTKRFEILQLIANYLSWDDDQKSQAGLVRGVAGGPGVGTVGGNGSVPGTPGGSFSGPSSSHPLSPRSASFSRGPGGATDSGTSGGGFMSMFADFLERESSRRK